eukprot:6742609-Alexandrium_andersonii.AAC.1
MQSRKQFTTTQHQAFAYGHGQPERAKQDLVGKRRNLSFIKFHQVSSSFIKFHQVSSSFVK